MRRAEKKSGSKGNGQLKGTKAIKGERRTKSKWSGLAEEMAERRVLVGKAKETISAMSRRKVVKMVSIYACVSPCILGLTKNNILNSR